jgi:signal transduction histidine kinase
VFFAICSTAEAFGATSAPDGPEPGVLGATVAKTVSRPVAPNHKLPVLSEIVQVRELSASEASRGYPVRITGVVTYSDNATYLHFVQDDSAGIYIDMSTATSDFSLLPRQRITVVGFSGPGDYAPVVHAESVEVIGQSDYPVARPTMLRTLMTGWEDSQWVGLKGVIRSRIRGTNEMVLSLSTLDAAVDVILPASAGTPPAQELVDAAVEVHGVCATLFNDRRRLQGVKLCVPEWRQLEIKEPAPVDPYKLPLQSVAELFQFQHNRLHRMHVKGVVIRRQDDGSFFLQEGEDGIYVRPRRSARFCEVGSAVEVVGFPGIQDKMPILQEALVKTIARADLIAVRPLNLETALREEYHATLVRIEGRVLGQSDRPTEDALTLQCGERVFDAFLEKGSSRRQFAGVHPGSIVAVTGVYVALLDAQRKIQSFQLLLRSPADVVLESSPSWWTLLHTCWVFGGLGAALLLVLGWVGSLRKQVQQRTRQLRAEIEERKRAEEGLKTAQGELLRTSRLAGMAEVATSVLHNVGNVLNSVNVSANLILEQTKRSKVRGLDRAAALMRQHDADLGQFITTDPKGRQLPGYLSRLSEHLCREQAVLVEEIESLRKNIAHIKIVVTTQQSYAQVVGVTESVTVPELIEDALRVTEESLTCNNIRLVRDYPRDLPAISTDKHKVLQILVNLLRNAKHACTESDVARKSVTICAANGDDRLKISIIDNGVGIAEENLARIFNHGFTTRKNGHGFGLHSGALAARELGGSLTGRSEGPGKGATFTLELPVTSNPKAG